MKRWARVLALGALSACHPPVPVSPASVRTLDSCPTDVSTLRTAQSLAILDTWASLGCGYHFQASLERAGDSYVGSVSVGAHGDTLQSREVRGPWSLVQGWLDELAVRRVTTEPANERVIQLDWTDDYPRVEVTVRGEQQTPRLVYYPDQHREWHLADGERACRFVSGSSDRVAGEFRRHRRIHERYDTLTEALGLKAFIDADCGEANR